MLRMPAVAGQFYPGEAQTLHKMVSSFLGRQAGAPACGIVVPHAGYVYSGAIAGETFARVTVPDRILVLGPNHHGIGHPAALYPEGNWATPLGEVSVDAELGDILRQECSLIAKDAAAHRLEHSLEVQIPFVQLCAPRAAIVPLCLGFLSLEELIPLGEGIGRALHRYPGEVLMVASSDMTHYESGDAAREKDGRALERILSLDPEGLWQTVREGRISMCGVMPVVVMLAAARALGARGGTLVRYGTSGDITGDSSKVVGYAGVVIH